MSKSFLVLKIMKLIGCKSCDPSIDNSGNISVGKCKGLSVIIIGIVVMKNITNRNSNMSIYEQQNMYCNVYFQISCLSKLSSNIYKSIRN